MNREKARIFKDERGIFKDERGISSVVATIILMAVIIVVAVALAYWMGGLAVLYTRFEKLEIASAYAIWNAEGNNWTVTVTLRNTGSAEATITGLLVNGKPWDDASFGGKIRVPSGTLPASLVPTGQPASIIFYIFKGEGFNPGVSIEIKLHSASGQDYPKIITLN